MASCLNFSLTEYQGRKLHKSFEERGLESRMISISNGSTIHCWVSKDFTPPVGNSSNADGNTVTAKSEKPLLVLLHGFGLSSMWQWSSQVKPLVRYFNLIMPDLLFFGRSTTTNPDRSESFQAECVWLVLSKLGISRFSVVGTSYGGFVAYRLTQAHPDAVDKLVISNSSICMKPEDDQELCKRGGAATIPELLLPTTRPGLEAIAKLVFCKPAPTWFIPSFIINDYLKVLYLPNREEKVELLEHLAFGKEAGPALLTKVDKEVLIIWGEADNIFPLEQAERIKEYLGERAELVVLKEAGHVSQMEQPAKWNSLVVKFLLGIELA
ncbi:unnamed protein product [Calypogeia fissa]